jgi:hypothetical protein
VISFLNSIQKNYTQTQLTLLINDVRLNSYYGKSYNYTGYGYGYGYNYGYGNSSKKSGYYDDEDEIAPKFTLKRILDILIPFKITTRKK